MHTAICRSVSDFEAWAKPVLCTPFDGKRAYQVSWKVYRPQRTLPQNSVLWMWATYVGQHTGNDKETVVSAWKKKWLPTQTIEICGVCVERLASSRSLNTAQFGEWLNQIQGDMLGEGYALPQPGEHGYEEMARWYQGERD